MSATPYNSSLDLFKGKRVVNRRKKRSFELTNIGAIIDGFYQYDITTIRNDSLRVNNSPFRVMQLWALSSEKLLRECSVRYTIGHHGFMLFRNSPFAKWNATPLQIFAND